MANVSSEPVCQPAAGRTPVSARSSSRAAEQPSSRAAEQPGGRAAKQPSSLGRAVGIAVLDAAHQRGGLGRLPPYVQIPMEAIDQVGEEFAAACTWLDEHAYRPDVAFTRAVHPDPMDLRTGLKRTGAAQVAGFLAAQGQ